MGSNAICFSHTVLRYKEAFMPATHSVTLHFRSLSLTNVPFQTHFRNAQRVYEQYGIQVNYGSGISLRLTDEQRQRYEQVDGECRWRIDSGEYAEIQSLGGPVPSTEIVVCYVNRFSGTQLGCGGHRPGSPACIVASSGSQWTTAHEVGHVLLGSNFSPVHMSSTRNLMYRSTPGITAALPELTDKQVRQIKSSPCCVRL